MPLPRGSKYPSSRVLGSKIHTLNGFWSLKPYYLGTWTLWVKVALKGSLEGFMLKGFCGDTERVFYGAVAKVQGLRLHV